MLCGEPLLALYTRIESKRFRLPSKINPRGAVLSLSERHVVLVDKRMGKLQHAGLAYDRNPLFKSTGASIVIECRYPIFGQMC